MASDSGLTTDVTREIPASPPDDPESEAKIDDLPDQMKDAAKAIAQAAHESEAIARAKSSSYTSYFRSTAISTLSQTDATLSHLSRLIQTPAHTDSLLLTTSSTLHLLSAILSSRLRSRINLETTNLVTKLRSTPLLPGEALVATITPSTTARSYRVQTSAKALAKVIDDFRMFGRLLGLVRMYAWLRATVRSQGQDKVLRGVILGQVGACMIYQVLENWAYLATKGVVELKGEKVVKFYRWSSRFWAIHVLLEFVRLWRVREQKMSNVEKDSKVEDEWWRLLYVNLAWFPLTWHYSVPGGLISENTVSVLSWSAGILGLRQAWRVTA